MTFLILLRHQLVHCLDVCFIVLCMKLRIFQIDKQWLKCNGTQGNAVPPPPIYAIPQSVPRLRLL